MKKIVIASSNAGKIEEFRQMFSHLNIELIDPKSLGNISVDVEETGKTFIENAIIKARHVSAQCGYPCLGDDSGLCIAALQGRPGVLSARYAGAHTPFSEKITRLLQELKATSDASRQAYFYCALALVHSPDDPTPYLACGRWDGEISHAPSGIHGFGYDPIFYLATHQCTAAELPAAEKNKLSHRAKALQSLVNQLDPCSA